MHRSASRRNRIIDSDEDEEPAVNINTTTKTTTSTKNESASSAIDMEADISTLQPATFSTIQKQQSEPMLHLKWDHKVNLIAGAVLNPLIHICEICDCPILSYGRMIPCKHVFCYDCACGQSACGRCEDNVSRVERAALGTLYMCVHDGSRYTNDGCRRTYLSQRDLQAHINHRHRRTSSQQSADNGVRAAVSGSVRSLSSSESRVSGAGSCFDPRMSRTDLARSRDPRVHCVTVGDSLAAASRATVTTAASSSLSAGAAVTPSRVQNLEQSSFSVPPPVTLSLPTQQVSSFSQYQVPAVTTPPFFQTTPPPLSTATSGFSRSFSAPTTSPPIVQYRQVPSAWTTPPPSLSQPPPNNRFFH